MKVLTILLILTTTSGCSLLRNNLIEPLCLPTRPTLQAVTVEEQIEINPDTLIKVARNDLKLKSYIKTLERITATHNEQFKAKCVGDTD